ncbi:MAG: hypothetical protein ABIF19_01165 [Planctomycetota bacterium]
MPIKLPMREVLPEELAPLPELAAPSRPLGAVTDFAAVEEGGLFLPIILPIRERDSVVGVSLDIDVDAVLLASMLPRRELKLERDEFEFVADGAVAVIEPPRFSLELAEGMLVELDRPEVESGCVLGVEMDGGCVVIELPMRDDTEELILPLEFVVDRLPTFDLELAPLERVAVELLPRELPILTDPVDLPADEELEGSLPTLTLPDGRDGVIRLDVIVVELRLGIVTRDRFVVGARLVMLLVEVLRLGDEMLGLLEELTDRELPTLLRLVLVLDGREACGAGAGLAA